MELWKFVGFCYVSKIISLSFLHCILWYGYITVCLTIHSLKVDLEVLDTVNEVAMNIHVEVSVWT